MPKRVPLNLDAIEARANAATDGPWEARAHAHLAAGCRCLSCDDPAVGWTVDHPAALDCDDLVANRTAAGETNDFGKPLTRCDAGPLLSFEDATFAACAREDVPALVAEVRALRALLATILGAPDA